MEARRTPGVAPNPVLCAVLVHTKTRDGDVVHELAAVVVPAQRSAHSIDTPPERPKGAQLCSA